MRGINIHLRLGSWELLVFKNPFEIKVERHGLWKIYKPPRMFRCIQFFNYKDYEK